MHSINLLEALCKLLNCEKVALNDYLNHPSALNKVDAMLKGKKLRTTYANRAGEQKIFTYGGVSLKSASEQHAYEGFLGINIL